MWVTRGFPNFLASSKFIYAPTIVPEIDRIVAGQKPYKKIANGHRGTLGKVTITVARTL